LLKDNKRRKIMGKYFGTDGVRGVANTELSPELAFKLGRAGAYILTQQVEKPIVVVGRDTRVSGFMLEAALVSGMLSVGADVVMIGVISTPGVAYLTRHLKASAGVMISASHNPVADNGIKFFQGDGFKLPDEIELQIEQLLDAEMDELPRPIGADVGKVLERYDAKDAYVDFLKTTVAVRFNGLKVVLDCAHGAAYELAPRLFADLGAEVVTIGASPDGTNINEGCGSTHPEWLRENVIRYGADVGLSFDGDADRLIAVDAEGEVVDGDYILTVCGDAMRKEGRLNRDTVVTTVMANMGFFQAANDLGLHAIQTAVGDRYVIEEMRKSGYNLGGEQSGHIIFLDYNTTGDGLLTALQLTQVVQQTGRPLGELKRKMVKFPQLLVNVQVKNKAGWKENPVIQEAIREGEETLGGRGRILVRPSGTEQLIRVMAEGPNTDELDRVVSKIADAVRSELSA
jgi:phosphoglucosamine mutase